MMRRSDLIEIHDHPRFPSFLRDLITDALQELWQFGESYAPILPLLHPVLKRSRTCDVLDLCSGGGGPWPSLQRRLARHYGMAARVRLSDKFPNLEAFEQVEAQTLGQIGAVTEPVDARAVPVALNGFRTMFSSFHHFSPECAIAVLRDAVKCGRGIGIFEVPQRKPLTMFALCFTPLLVLWLTLRIRPMKLSRLVWTYLIPVVPFVIWYDGMVSCLKAYSLDELNAMVEVVNRDTEAKTYSWRIGQQDGGFLPVTYLVGSPNV